MTLRTKDSNKNLNLLSEINKHPFDSRIRFREEGHKYWIDDNSKDLTSATTFIHSFFPEFDGETVVNNIINSYKYKKDKDYKYYGMTVCM